MQLLILWIFESYFIVSDSWKDVLFVIRIMHRKQTA